MKMVTATTGSGYLAGDIRMSPASRKRPGRRRLKSPVDERMHHVSM
jgi:hypothetical protein